MKKVNPFILVFFFITATIPFAVQANQPLVQGIYLSLTLLTCGSWLVINFREFKQQHFSYSTITGLVLLIFILLTALSMPIDIITSLSPVRGESLMQALQNRSLMTLTHSFSYYPPGSLQYTLNGLTLFVLFFFTGTIIKVNNYKKALLWTISLSGGIEALYGILQALFPEIVMLRFPGNSLLGNSPSGTFSTNTQYAVFLNICWPISLALGLSLFNNIIEKIEIIKIKKKKLTLADNIRIPFQFSVLPIWSTVLIIIAILLSGSTPGILVMLFLVILCRIIIPYPRVVKIIFSCVIYSALLLYGFMLGVQGIISQSQAIFLSIHEKYKLWTDSMVILKDHIFTGTGMGSLPYLYPVYFPQYQNNLTVGYLQNDYVTLTLELGLPAFVLVCCWILYGIIKYGVEIISIPRKLDKMTKDHIIIMGSYFALMGFLINLATTDILHIPTLTYYLIVVLAILSFTCKWKKETDYRLEQLFPTKKPVKFVPYRRKPARRRKG